MKRIEGTYLGQDLRVALVAARFNGFIVDSLVGGARDHLCRHGVADDDITLIQVPGAFEIPAVCNRAVASGHFDAVIALGCVIRGATAHFDYVCSQAAKGVGSLANDADIPVIFGVLTCDTIEQAIERAGTKAGNKGAEAAGAALEMVNLYKSMESSA